MKQFLYIAVILCAGSSAGAQNKSMIDSLRASALAQKNDTQKVMTLVLLSKQYYTSDPGSGEKHAREALDLARTKNFGPGVGHALNSLGNIHYLQGDYQSALRYHQEALHAREQGKNKSDVAASLTNIGSCYNNMGQYALSLKYLAQGARLDSMLKDTFGLSADYNNIGNVYGKMSDYGNSLKYLLLSLRLKQQLGDSYGESQTLANIGTVYKLNGQFENALTYYKDAAALSEQLGDLYGMAYVYNNLGALFVHAGKGDSAQPYFLRALALAKQVNDKTTLANATMNLGKLKRERGEYDKAFDYFSEALKLFEFSDDQDGLAYVLTSMGFLSSKRNQHANAVKYFNRSLQLSKGLEMKERMKDAYEGLYTSYAALQDFSQALHYHKLYTDLTDSIFTVESGKQMADMETKYQTDKKEQQIRLLSKSAELQAAELARKKVLTWWLLAGALVCIVAATVVFTRFRITQRQKQVIQAQKVLVDEAYEELHEKNKEVLDSIFYARRIQRALITSERYITKSLDRINGKL
jgi:tetratricopeptide (TPR) repeat protein